MYRYRAVLLILFLIPGLAGNSALAHPGRGPMENKQMMESIDSEYEFLVKMIPHHEEAVVAIEEKNFKKRLSEKKWKILLRIL